MSLENLVKHAEAKGRAGDDTLVHMSKGEVRALNGIANAFGGELTRNPDTGLPEANFLQAILPTVAGGLLAATGVGAPLAAGIVGLGTGLITGSMEKGLMAGIGAFGGAGLGAGLANAGAAAAGNAATAGALPAAQAAGSGAAAATGASTAVPTIASPFADLAASGATGSLTTAATPSAVSLASPFADMTATSALGSLQAAAAPSAASVAAPFADLGVSGATGALTTPATAASPGFLGGMSNNLSNMGRGIQQLFTDPTAAIGPKGESAFDMVGGWKGIGTAGLTALAPAMMGSNNNAQTPAQSPVSEGNIQTYSFNRTPRVNRQPGERFFDSGYTKTGTYAAKDFRGYNEGGLASMQGQEGGEQEMIRIEAPPTLQRTTFSQERLAQPDASGRRFNQQWGVAELSPQEISAGMVPDITGIGALEAWASQLPEGVSRDSLDFSQGYAMVPKPKTNKEGGYEGYAAGGQPRHLKGPGDGLSDSIPAVVDGVQPAALATDEFVVPADVVSQLGNGSSDAGAQKLYAMMDRIRQQAHGKKRQQRPVNEAKVLPA